MSSGTMALRICIELGLMVGKLLEFEIATTV